MDELEYFKRVAVGACLIDPKEGQFLVEFSKDGTKCKFNLFGGLGEIEKKIQDMKKSVLILGKHRCGRMDDETASRMLFWICPECASSPTDEETDKIRKEVVERIASLECLRCEVANLISRINIDLPGPGKEIILELIKELQTIESYTGDPWTLHE